MTDNNFKDITEKLKLIQEASKTIQSLRKIALTCKNHEEMVKHNQLIDKLMEKMKKCLD